MIGRLSGRLSITALVLALLSGSAALAARDWPGFRGPGFEGAVRDARLFEEETGGLELGWKKAIGPGYSALAVSQGLVLAMFAAGDADVLGAFDVETGEERWRYRIADTYAGHDGSHDGPISTPFVSGKQVFGLGAFGHLFAVDIEDGREIWSTHLADDHGAKKPHYGFTTSPLVADGVLVVEIGAEGKAVAGFDPKNGKLLWSLGEDSIEYQSPIVAEIAGKQHVIAVGKKNLWALDAKKGEVAWSFEHGGDDRAMGGATIVPVPAGKNRLFLMNKIDSSVMLEIKPGISEVKVEEVWSNNAIKSSYVTPVYHEGHLYGMSNRIFTCLDAETGDVRWRSREPGDGFPTLVGNHLVIITKPGTLHVAKASSQGYEEVAQLELFEDHSWSEVAFADGHLFARSMGSLARIDPLNAADAAGTESWIASTEFGAFLREVAEARDKEKAVDAFLARQPAFPLIEPSGAVHFLYRGEAEDVGIVGDMIGFRREDPMTRIAGTDLFHYSTRLEPDAAVTYGFIPDYGDPIPDPMNDRPGKGLFGEVSWFSMPAWDPPTFLDDADEERQGKLVDIEWESAVREGEKRTAQVYLPAGYEDDDRRYPVIYYHSGQEALEEGNLKRALDHLIGTRVAPVIVVFVHTVGENPNADIRRPDYGDVVTQELVPKIDSEFRTIPEAVGRATVGSGSGANAALMTGFAYSDIFGRVGAQGATVGVEQIAPMKRGADEQPLVIYMEWGTYHLRSPHEAWDLARENRRLWDVLREDGYRPSGGEVPEGVGWQCWNGHTDELLAALFPVGS